MENYTNNTIEGWTTQDWLSGTYQKGNYSKTNLFNLTYRITDEDGNNIQMYSLDEVQIKLSGLKKWLTRYILPVSTNIIDITGVADAGATMYLKTDSSNVIEKFTSDRKATVVNFDYLETLNFGTNYLVTVNFYTNNDYCPSGWTSKIVTYSLSGTTLIPQQYFKLFKTDLDSFSFNIDATIDPYLYVETTNTNGSGLGMTNSRLFNAMTGQNYVLINNNFDLSKYNYLNFGDNYYYFFDNEGYINLLNELPPM
jgi:hypothetical protein